MVELSLAAPSSPRFRSAWQRGYEARLRGVSRYSCPYEPKPGWSGAYAKAWSDGWNAADETPLIGERPIVNVDDTYPEEDL